MEKTHLQIPSKVQYIEPALALVRNYHHFLLPDEKKALSKIVSKALFLVMEKNKQNATLDLDIFEESDALNIEIINHGIPLLFENNDLQQHQDFKHLCYDLVDTFHIKNMGRQGQKLILKLFLREKEKMDRQFANTLALEEIDPKEITIRNPYPSEAKKLCELFYNVYDYNYINENIYFPEKIKEMWDQKRLISFIAIDSKERILGHVGLIRWNQRPIVYEAALGAVDPQIKSKGLFGNIFTEVINHLKTLEMKYCFFDFVTNHDLSQRFISKFGTHEMALMIGVQSKHTQAKLQKLGLGDDPHDMDRYSILYSVIAGEKYPFGKHIYLPYPLGEAIEFLLPPLNLSWSPVPRFYPLPSEGSYQKHQNLEQQSIHFDIFDPGFKAIRKLLMEWSKLLKDGYQYASIDIPLERPGLSVSYDLLAEHGFFIAGLLPYNNTAQLCFRFQSLGHTKVAFDKIKVYGTQGKKLLEIIENNYQRNCLI